MYIIVFIYKRTLFFAFEPQTTRKAVIHRTVACSQGAIFQFGCESAQAASKAAENPHNIEKRPLRILLVSTRSGRYFFTATFLLLRNLQRLSNLDVVALDAVGFFKF